MSHVDVVSKPIFMSTVAIAKTTLPTSKALCPDSNFQSDHKPRRIFCCVFPILLCSLTFDTCVLCNASISTCRTISYDVSPLL